MNKFLFFVFLIITYPIHVSYSNQNKFNDKFKLEKISETINYPWGMSFLNKKKVLVSSKPGSIYLIDLDKFTTKIIHKIIDTQSYGQGGLLDIMNIKIKSTNYLFVCYLSKLDNEVVIERYKLDKLKLLEKKTIFKSNYNKRSGKHFGCRLTNYKKSILATIGDRGDRENSQNARNYSGSIIQLSYEGDKLGYKNNSWLKGIFSIGHRNPQGLIYLKEFNQIWSHEHGPKGGDEINIINKGYNYGWPIVSYGKEYWGGKIGDGISKKGYVDPIWKWIPSIAPSGMDYYNLNYFKELKSTLLVGSLKYKALYAVKIKDQKPISELVVFKNKIGRIRDVLVHPTGYILLLNDEHNGGLYKMRKR